MKKRFLTMLVISLIITFSIIGCSSAPTSTSGARPMRWEYMCLQNLDQSGHRPLYNSWKEIMDEANRLGREGWELTTTVDDSYGHTFTNAVLLFKRALP